MKPRVLTWILIFSCSELICNASSFFDLEELKSVNYGIDIRNEPVVMKTDVDITDLNTVKLTSKYGQVYQCNFPNTAEQEKENEEAEKVAVETGIPDLLKPMETGPCLKMNNGWWTYQFCYGRAITQYHLNEDGNIEGEVLSLGVYESEFDWEDNSGQTDVEKKQNRLRRHHTQQYVNGTACDLNGNQRKTEVRFVCEEGNGDYINRVDEPETCSYIMAVHTTKICHHPFLKPPTPTKTVAITCHPLLTVIQYQEYLDEIEANDRKKKQEDEKQRLQEEEQHRLAKEKSKYFKQAQEMEELDEGEQVDESKVSDDLLKEMINTASTQLKQGEDIEVDSVFQVIDNPSDMDEFIKKAMEKIMKTTKGSSGKKTEADHEAETLDDGSLLDEEDQDEDMLNKELNEGNKKFGAKGSESDRTNLQVLQAVDAIKKLQKDQIDAIKKLNRQKWEKIKQANSKYAAKSEKVDDEDEEEGFVEDELEEDLNKETGTDRSKAGQNGKRHGDEKEEDDIGHESTDTDIDDADLSDLMQKVDDQLFSMINAQKAMAKLNSDLTDLLEEENSEDKEIKTIKSKYQDKRGRLVDIKQRLRQLMEKEYESIVKETEEELGIEQGVDRATANRELAQTLDGLLAKLDRTEQEIKDVDKELEQFAEFDGDEKVKSVPPVRDDLEPVKGPGMVEGADETDDRVQVRVSRIKAGEKYTGANAHDANTEALEKSVQEELAKAGFANGDKIQVKIITNYYDGDDDSVHTLSEKDSETFKNLIVNLIGGTHEGDKEAVRIQEQEDNYRFVYGKQKPTAIQTADGEQTPVHSSTDRNTDTHTDIQEDDGS